MTTWNLCRIATLLSVLVFLALSLLLAARLTIWIDEAWSLESSSYGIHEAFRRAGDIEEQPPFYFVLLALWRSINESLFFARVLSIIFVGGAGWFLVRTLSDHRASGSTPLLVLALALNPFVLYAATEVRVYGLAMLLSAAMLWAFSRIHLLADRRHIVRGVYVLAAICAVYTQYFMWALVGSFWLYTIIFSKRNRRVHASIDFAFVVIAFVPQALVLLQQLTVQSVGGVERSVGIFESATEVIRFFVDFALPSVTGAPTWPKWVAAVPLAAALLVGIVRIWRSRSVTVELSRATVFVIALGAIGLTGAFWYLGHEDFFRLRYALFLFVPTVTTVIATLSNALFRRAVIAYLVVLLLLGAFGSYHRYADFQKAGSWDQIGEFLEETDTTGGALYTFPPDTLLPLKHYLDRTEDVYGIPVSLRDDHFDYADFVFSSPEQLEARFRETRSGDTVRLLTYYPYDYRGINYKQEILEEFVSERYDVVEKREFPGVVIRVLRRKK